MTASPSSTSLDPFFPPRPSPLLRLVTRALSSIILRTAFSVESVEMDFAPLRRLRGAPAFVVGNHPSLTEPAVLFVALSRAGIDPYFMAAWDTMAFHGDAFRWALQRLGGYSVQRARRDRTSMQMTQNLLAHGEKIVVFPEGQTYGLNDTLLPFQQGVVQLGFWALDDSPPGKPLYIQPVAVKYLCAEPPLPQIDASLARLEAELRLPPGPAARYSRLVRIASVLLGRLAAELSIELPVAASLDERIDAVRNELVRILSDTLDVQPPRDATFPALVQFLGNAHEDAMADEERDADSKAAIQASYRHWQRLKNFIAVRDGYVRDRPTPERFLDVLGRLENEILGNAQIQMRRRALLLAGEPVNLDDHRDDYRAHKRATVATLTAQVEERVRAALGVLEQRSRVQSELAAPG